MIRAALLIFSMFLVASPALAQDETTEPKTGFVEKLNFEKGTFLGDANVKFMALIDQIEVWRLDNKTKIDTSLDSIETRREDQKDPSTAVKVLTVLHIALLALLLFVFSLQFVFWTIAIIVAIMIIRRLIRFIIGLFRRDHISA